MTALDETVQAAGFVRVLEELVRQTLPDPVVDRVAEHRGGDEDRYQNLDPHDAARRQRAGGEQQRVAGEERRDDETGFREDDGEQNAVGDQAVVLNEGREVLVDIEKKIEHEPASVTHAR